MRCEVRDASRLTVAPIVIIHWRLGWFVGEHGSGGMEYSVSLMVSLLVIAAADAATSEKVGTFPARGA